MAAPRESRPEAGQAQPAALAAGGAFAAALTSGGQREPHHSGISEAVGRGPSRPGKSNTEKDLTLRSLRRGSASCLRSAGKHYWLWSSIPQGGAQAPQASLLDSCAKNAPTWGWGVPLCFSRPSKVSSGLMHVLSPGGHSPGELALIIGFTETQTGLPLSSGGPWRPPWFPRRHGAMVLPAALCHYEALPRISSDYGWNFLRSPKLFLESNYSSKLLIQYLFLG